VPLSRHGRRLRLTASGARGGAIVNGKYEYIINRYKWHSVHRGPELLYGLWRLKEFPANERIFLCQGVENVWTLWHANLPAVGVSNQLGWHYSYFVELVPNYSEIIVIPHRNPEGFALVRHMHAIACGEDFESKLRFVVLPEERAIFTANDLWIAVEADAERFRAELAACETLDLYGAFVDATWKCVVHELVHASSLLFHLHKTQLRIVDHEIRLHFRERIDFAFFSSSRQRYDFIAELLRGFLNREDAPVMLIHDPEGRFRLAAGETE
jgi:hypothetical protein